MPDFTNRYRIKIGGTAYTNPTNWKGFTPTTERHEIYRALLTTFSEGVVVLVKDAKDYVDGVYSSYGTTETVAIEWAEWDVDTGAYVDIFAIGRLNLNVKYKRTRDTTEVGFEPVDFVQNFLNRDEIKTDLQRLVDMDGDDITTFTNETQTITINDQVLEQRASFEMYGTNFAGDPLSPSYSSPIYVMLPVIRKEFKTNNPIISVLSSVATHSSDVPDYSDRQIRFIQDGDVVITFTNLSIRVLLNELTPAGGYTLTSPPVASLVYRLNNGAEVVLDTDALPATGSTEFVDLVKTTLTLSGVNKGDELMFYVKITNLTGSSPPVVLVSLNNAIATTEFVQQSTYDDTTCEVMLVWEFLLRMCQKITGRNDCLRSDYFGRTDGEVNTYGSDGDGSLFAITTGKLIRGFPLATNPINIDFMTAFKSLDSIFALGMGIVYESDVPFIKIEPLKDWFDKTSSLTTFTAESPGITWESAGKYLWGNVKCGFRNWKLENEPTQKSPHTPRTYSLPYISEHVQDTYESECEMIASGHLIESLRRRPSGEITEDTPHDENLIIFQVKRDSGFVKLEDDNMYDIVNIDNQDSQFNLEITPARNITRHAPLLLAGLQKRILLSGSFNEFLKFQSGEGNTNAVTELTTESSLTYYLKVTSISGTPTVGSVIFIFGGITCAIQSLSPDLYTWKVVQIVGDMRTVPAFLPASIYASWGTATLTAYAGVNAIKEGEDILRGLLNANYQDALFDASEMGVCTVKITKSQRQQIIESITEYVEIVDNTTTYYGFIESIKEIDLEQGIAELRFLKTVPDPGDQFILQESGDKILQENNDDILQEQST